MSEEATSRLTIKILFLAVIFIIIAHLYLGLLSYPQSDDFHSLKRVQEYGLIGTLKSVYLSWSGRTGPIFINYLADRLGVFPYFTNFFVATTIGLLMASIALVCKKIDGFYSKIILLDMALFLLALPMAVKQDGLYWFSGNITYLLPIVFVGFTITNVSRTLKQKYEPALLVLTFTAYAFFSAFNEQIAAVLLVGLTAVRFFLRPLRKYILYRLIAMLLGVMVGSAILLLSPGSYVRLAHFQDLTIYRWDSTVYEAVFFVITLLVYSVIRSKLLPADIPRPHTELRQKAYLPVAITFSCALTGIAVVIIGYRGGVPSPRTLLLPYICLLIMGIFCSKAIGWEHFQHRLNVMGNLKHIIVFLFLCIAIPMPFKGIQDLTFSVLHAEEQRLWVMDWFDSFRAAKLGGINRVQIQKMPHNTLLDVRHTFGSKDDPFRYNNRCLSRYFDVKVLP